MSKMLFKFSLDLAITSIALASLIFMELVFAVEVQGGRITYYEPNRTIAFIELLMTCFGFGGTVGMFLRRLWK